jgi:hypothetical protein
MKKRKRCVACEVQDRIGSAPHEPGCRCYGVAFLMGIAQAAFMAQTGEDAVLCDACLVVIRDLLATERGLKMEKLLKKVEAEHVH